MEKIKIEVGIKDGAGAKHLVHLLTADEDSIDWVLLDSIIEKAGLVIVDSVVNEPEESELDPYFEDGYWRLPYLMNGAGGFGGGVGEMKDETKEGVIQMYKDYHS